MRTGAALYSTSLFDFLRGCVSRVLLERPKHEGYYPVLSGTLPLPQVTMAKNVHRAQKCAMTGCPQIYNPLILKVAKRDL